MGTGLCREREALLDSYADATKELFARGRELSDAARSYEADFFQTTWDRCETARRRCADLRHKLTAHMHEHGCELDVFRGADPAD